MSKHDAPKDGQHALPKQLKRKHALHLWPMRVPLADVEIFKANPEAYLDRHWPGWRQQKAQLNASTAAFNRRNGWGV